MKVLVVDYGMSNLGSVSRALEECGGDVCIASTPESLEGADRIVLPGVGAFKDGMSHLVSAGWPGPLREATNRPGVRLLGICLGMQLLCTRGHEGGEIEGLDLVPGSVVRLKPEMDSERIPHVGWNEVYPNRDHPLTRGVAPGTDFYFVHSYHFTTLNPEHVLANTPYCGSFASIVGCGNVMGTQFHPEKSSKPGFQILRNFLAR